MIFTDKAPTFCIDCAEDGKRIQCIFDQAYLGEVCPRCRRVYSPIEPGSNKRYTEKKFALRAIERDRANRRHQLSSVKAMADFILKDREI